MLNIRPVSCDLRHSANVMLITYGCDEKREPEVSRTLAMARFSRHPYLRTGAFRVCPRQNFASLHFHILNINLPPMASAGGS
jgi:hypothetical protein